MHAKTRQRMGKVRNTRLQYITVPEISARTKSNPGLDKKYSGARDKRRGILGLGTNVGHSRARDKWGHSRARDKCRAF